MKITVTEQHIKDGHIATCRTCPIALALNDAGFPAAQVSQDGIYLTGHEAAVRIEPPASVRAFVKTFDHLGVMAVCPFEFELDCGS